MAEIRRHLLKRRPRASPRVIKRKMSNWKLKPPGTSHAPPKTVTVTIVAATKPAPTSRNKPKETG
jgi:hypothetical protein